MKNFKNKKKIQWDTCNSDMVLRKSEHFWHHTYQTGLSEYAPFYIMVPFYLRSVVGRVIESKSYAWFMDSLGKAGLAYVVRHN